MTRTSRPATAPTVTGRPAGPVGTAEPADLVAAAVRAVPGVADLHPGPFGEAATYLPGRRVVGVRLRPDGAEVAAEVHVALLTGAPVLDTADLVRRAAEQVLGRPVLVAVEDLLPAPAGEPPSEPPSEPHTAVLGAAPGPIPGPIPGTLSDPTPGAPVAGGPFVDMDGEPR